MNAGVAPAIRSPQAQHSMDCCVIMSHMADVRSPDCDVIVIGAGPAGSSAALALAKQGRKVVLFERERFPRFHIGESLLATANECFDELGLTERIRAAGFPQKLGASLATHNKSTGRIVDFTTCKEVRRGQTWQVCREKFDHILLQAVREAGTDVRESHRVLECVFDPHGVAVRFEDAGGIKHELYARAVVDASGRWGLLARTFGLRRDEPRLANVAVFAHYSGVPPLPKGRENDIRIVARKDAGWFWVIPIDNRLTSVGVVLPRTLFQQRGGAVNEETLQSAYADTPVMADLMKDAVREWPVRVEKDFSYGSTAYAGDRWLLVGDAGSFLDPVFSTGVSIALESGLEAAKALELPLTDGRFQRSRFRAFERRQAKRFKVFRRFVIGFYTPWFRDLFLQPAGATVPQSLFRAVVTILAGKWNPSFVTRLLIQIFFGATKIQRYVPIVPSIAVRDKDAGFQLH